MNQMFEQFSLFLSVDPTLGRVDKSSFTQQTLMEFLIEGITENADKIHQGKTEDITEWKHLKFADDTGDLIDISPTHQELEGSLQLQYLPDSVQFVCFLKNYLSGSVDLTSLPRKLIGLNLSENDFSGSLNLTHLPATLKKLMIGHNQLSGSLDLTQLPEELFILSLNNNGFVGEADFSKLPDSLKRLNISRNVALSGEIRNKNVKVDASVTNVIVW